MIREHDRVALTEDLAEYGRTRRHRYGGDGPQDPRSRIGIRHAGRRTLPAVVSAYPHQVRPLGKREIAQARSLEHV